MSGRFLKSFELFRKALKSSKSLEQVWKDLNNSKSSLECLKKFSIKPRIVLKKLGRALSIVWNIVWKSFEWNRNQANLLRGQESKIFELLSKGKKKKEKKEKKEKRKKNAFKMRELAN